MTNDSLVSYNLKKKKKGGGGVEKWVGKLTTQGKKRLRRSYLARVSRAVTEVRPQFHPAMAGSCG